MTRRKRKPRRASKKRVVAKRDDRYNVLYLLERVSEKNLWNRIRGYHEIKIGVTRMDANYRKEQIEDKIPGNFVVSSTIWIPGYARYYEQKLLTKWDRWFDPGGERGNGQTEIRAVNWLEHLFVFFDFFLIRHRKLIGSIIFLIIVGIFAYAYFLDYLK